MLHGLLLSTATCGDAPNFFSRLAGLIQEIRPALHHDATLRS